MTFVVPEECIRCKHTDCVEVCLVDCFYEGLNSLIIHPDECIDYALCEPECPVAAIRAEDEVPLGQRQFIALNGELAAHPNWAQITHERPASDDHSAWFGLPGKLAELDRNGTWGADGVQASARERMSRR